jgi:uncharacterized OsmC-like protein
MATALDHSLFITPRGEGNGFQARVRGHVLDLIDPGSYALSPTTDDLFIVSLAGALAWSARSFLRAEGLPEYVSVSATWQTHDDPPALADIALTVTVSREAAAVQEALTSALETSLSTRSLATPTVRVSLEE